MLGTGNVRAAIYLGPTNHVLLEKFGEKRGHQENYCITSYAVVLFL